MLAPEPWSPRTGALLLVPKLWCLNFVALTSFLLYRLDESIFTFFFKFITDTFIFFQFKQDFNTLFPGRENLLLEKWPAIKASIIDELNLKTFRNVRDRAMHMIINTLSAGNYTCL